MSQRLPVNGFEWIEQLSEFDDRSIKNYDENNNKGYILEVDVEYQKNLFNPHCDLPFLPERKKIEKCKKLVYNTNNKENYVVHIRALKQALNYGLILKKVFQFNQKAWLKPYIDINTKLRTEEKIVFEKDFFKLMNNAVFGKTVENVRKHRNIKLVATDKRRNQLASEILMSILDISKTLMYEIWYDEIKPKYQDKAKLSYMDSDSFIIHTKTEHFYKDIANDVEKWFDTCNYNEIDKTPLPRVKTRK